MRQETAGDWAGVVERVVGELTLFSQAVPSNSLTY